MATQTKLILETIVKGTSSSRKALKSISKSIKGISTSVKKSGKDLKKFAQNSKDSFQKIAGFGIVAFGAISLGVRKMTQDAAEAEGTWNKFNTVFGETKDDMKEFIKDIRTRMPVATDDIARMAADLQDLLVPLGLSRELGADMTKGFLEVSNAIGAFNDVNPKEVLEAIKSGLTGISMPLKRFGVDASVGALEAIALEEGLLKVGEKFSQLEPKIRNQIRAQALLAQITDQSSDAINGFEKNSDSLIFRQLELKASLSDLSGTMGKVFLPIIDNVVKSIIPLVKKFSEWAEENPELIKQITKIGLIASGLAIILGTLGLVIPGIIAGFGGFIKVIKLLAIALRFLALNPIGLVIIAIAAGIAIGIAIVKNWDTIKKKAGELGDKIVEMAGTIKLAWVNAWDNIKTVTGPILGRIRKLIFNWGVNIKKDIDNNAPGIISAWANAWDNIKTVTNTKILLIKTKVRELIVEAKQWGANLIQMFIDGLKEKIQALKAGIIKIATTIKDFLGFGSPTDKGPNKDSDKWIPNLVKMLTDGFNKGEGPMEKAVSSFAKRIGETFNKETRDKLKQAFSDIADSAKSAFNKIRSAISSQKEKIRGLVNEYKALKEEIKSINKEIKDIRTTGAQDIATRAVEIQNELQEDITSEKRLQLQEELQLAKSQVTSNEIAKARIELEKSQTQKIIDRIKIRVEEAKQERQRIMELMQLKRLQIESEAKKHKEMVDQKKQLDKVYFDFFGERIREQLQSVNRLIARMKTLISLSGGSVRGGGIEGARAEGGPVQRNKTFLVGERGPELFTPQASGQIIPNNKLGNSGNNIIINISGIFGTDAVDEIGDQLVNRLQGTVFI